jgi:hypothetical protein
MSGLSLKVGHIIFADGKYWRCVEEGELDGAGRGEEDMKQPKIVTFHPLGLNPNAFVALDDEGRLWRRVPWDGKYIWEVIPGPTLDDVTTLRPSTPC